MSRSLTQLIHGDAKTGKTFLADSSPAPRLVLDAEGGNRFTPSRKVIWDPEQYAPPVADGTWDTCVVPVRNYSTLTQSYAWLNTYAHPFRSVTLDSISEAQSRCVDAIAGTRAMETQDWGELLRSVSTLARQLRDLVEHPTHPIEVVNIIAMTRMHDGKWSPYVQGALATRLPYYFDVVSYMYTEQVPETGEIQHSLLLHSIPTIIAGDRTGRLPVKLVNPTVPAMLDQIYGPLAA